MATANEIEMQAKWEQYAVDEGVKRFRAAMEGRSTAEMPGAQRFMRDIVGPLAESIKQAQIAELEDAGKPGKRPEWRNVVELLGADGLAVLTVQATLRGLTGDMASGMDERGARSAVTPLANFIGALVQNQVEALNWNGTMDKGADTEAWANIQRRYPEMTAKTWSVVRKRLETLRREDWGPAIQTQVGAHLLCLLVKASNGSFTMDFRRRGVKTTAMLFMSAVAIEKFLDAKTRAELAGPYQWPMLIPPNPWVYEGDKASGGFIIHKAPLIRSTIGSHTRALERPVSQETLDALNAIQATPWRINPFILDVLAKASADDIALPGIPGLPPVIPGRLSANVWAYMPLEERKAHQLAKVPLFEARAKWAGSKGRLADCILVAEKLRDRASIWFPHTLDFRMRIYPLSVHGPHPQGDDMAKGLLMFGSGLPLGPDGLYWLCIRAANCAGRDKLDLEERVKWALDNADDIIASAEDPFGHRWWVDVAGGDEPWGFLATCNELAKAFRMGSPEEFVSHLPIPLDGSCNGLQHLSAMGLDPVGAHATNLTADPVRQDIYEEIAERVREFVERDAGLGDARAEPWRGKVTRAVCKRAVMTTPYGVTDSGIRAQLLSDGNCDDVEGSRSDAATYLGERLVEALGATVTSAKEIMSWLQDTARALAVAGLPFDWTNPSGSRCRQAYYNLGEQAIRTLAGALQLRYEQAGASMPPRKQALGAAPNFVHSCDAAHVVKTTLAGAEDGIRSWAMIHDSFGTHAHNTTALSVILRQTFVQIHDTDILRELYADIRSRHPHVELREPPARGTFNLDEVLEAPFFFS